MFLNILRVSGSNGVLKMFVSVTVSMGCAVIIFLLYKLNQPEAQIHFIELAATLAGKEKT